MRSLFTVASLAMLLATPSALQIGKAEAQGVTPEVEACQASGLIALKEKNPGLKNIIVDAATLSESKADAKVGDTLIKTVIMGEAHLETSKTDKARRFLCLIGEKGKVVLTFFTTP